MEHPDYPIRRHDREMDRCVCGGVRHWHAKEPHGCDDCECEGFVPAPEQPRTAFVVRANGPGEPHVVLSVYAAPGEALLGTLTMNAEEAEDFCAALGQIL